MGQISDRFLQLYGNQEQVNPEGQEFNELMTEDYFYLGREKFKHVAGSKTLLFGNEVDGFYLKHQVVKMRLPPAVPKQPIKPLQVTMNIRKETIRLVEMSEGRYQVSFTFDSMETAHFTMFFLAQQSLENKTLHFQAKHSTQTQLFSPGKCQSYVLPIDGFSPLDIAGKNEWMFTEDDFTEDTRFPVVLLVENELAHCRRNRCTSQGVDIGDSAYGVQQQVTFCALTMAGDGKLCLQMLRQKILVDGVPFVLQDIYGLESKVSDFNGNSRRFSLTPTPDPFHSKPLKDPQSHLSSAIEEEELDAKSKEPDEMDCMLEVKLSLPTSCTPPALAVDDNISISLECVICLSATRDTLVLPCRHLCVCATCAQHLRRGYSTCPICRAPFCALLCLHGVRLKTQPSSRESQHRSAVNKSNASASGHPSSTNCSKNSQKLSSQVANENIELTPCVLAEALSASSQQNPSQTELNHSLPGSSSIVNQETVSVTISDERL